MITLALFHGALLCRQDTHTLTRDSRDSTWFVSTDAVNDIIYVQLHPQLLADQSEENAKLQCAATHQLKGCHIEF
jgi:hypothetical protein